jgi:hypothetical protein
MFADGNKTSKIKHILPIIPVYFIIITVTIVYTNYYALNTNVGNIKYLTASFFYFNSLMVVVCHSLAMWTNPGQVDKTNSASFTPNINDHLYCKKCQERRPERAHHCKVCNKCVLKMDHHCPWIANCVGLYNQKFFYQFLFHATLGDLIAFICLFNRLSLLDFDLKLGNRNFNTVGEIFYEIREPLLMLLGCILSISMVIGIGFLLIVQTKCIMFNLTAIEEKIYFNKINPWKNENNKLDNMKMVLGNEIYKWLIPIDYGQYDYNKSDKNIFINNNENYLSLSENINEHEENHITLNLQD